MNRRISFIFLIIAWIFVSTIVVSRLNSTSAYALFWVLQTGIIETIQIYSPIIHPFASLKASIRIYNFARPIPLAIMPLSLENPSIWPVVFAFAFFLIESILTLIFPPVLPLIDTFSVHHIVLPLSYIHPSIAMPVCACSLYLTLLPLPVILWPIRPFIQP